MKNRIKNRIEERIRPLVEALNDIPYISTFSSCEGHFSLEDIDHNDKAYIRFRLDESRKEEFEILKKNVLISTAEDCWDYSIVFYQRCHFVPYIGINVDYLLEIEAFSFTFNGKMNDVEKRRVTDDGIIKVTEIIRDYLSRKQ